MCIPKVDLAPAGHRSSRQPPFHACLTVVFRWPWHTVFLRALFHKGNIWEAYIIMPDLPFKSLTPGLAVICKVCLQSVRKSIVLCKQCSLITHTKCTSNAPLTCNLHSQLLVNVQYAGSGYPLNPYSPIAIARNIGTPTSLTSQTSNDCAPQTSQQISPKELVLHHKHDTDGQQSASGTGTTPNSTNMWRAVTAAESMSSPDPMSTDSSEALAIVASSSAAPPIFGAETEHKEPKAVGNIPKACRHKQVLTWHNGCTIQ